MKFAIDHDLHIHSRLSSCSNHPDQTPDAILQYAKDNGLRHVVLTDHFWDETVPGASGWYQPQNLPHIKESLPLPTADGITFGFGCETEMDRFSTVGISRATADGMDFIIVPTNHLHMLGFTIPEECVSVRDRADWFMARNHALLDMELPFPKMGLAHFTCSLMARGCEGSRDDIINTVTDERYGDFFTRAAAKGIGIELNMHLKDASNESALRPYRIARACGCTFYLGSDAHTPEELAKAHARFEAVVDALELSEEDKLPLVRS
jgi:histidinol phosphatase-like PHP family hydrolase